MSVVIVLCKWCSRGACKQFLVSRNTALERLFTTPICLSVLFPACTEEHLARFRQILDKSLIDAFSLSSGFWDPKSLWRELLLKRNVLFSFFFPSLGLSWEGQVIFNGVNIWI